MSYNKTTWKNGDTITADKLNNIEDGISSCIDSQECKAYIIDTYSNGSSFYMVYSNGFCIQGGEIYSPNEASQTVTLLKEYRDIDYLCLNCCKGTSTASSVMGNNAVGPLSTTSIRSMSNSAQYSTTYWLTIGHLKEGEY